MKKKRRLKKKFVKFLIILGSSIVCLCIAGGIYSIVTTHSNSDKLNLTEQSIIDNLSNEEISSLDIENKAKVVEEKAEPKEDIKTVEIEVSANDETSENQPLNLEEENQEKSQIEASTN